MIRCTIYGSPVSDVRWFRDGVPLIQYSHRQVQGREVILTGASGRDAGVYQCLASNSMVNKKPIYISLKLFRIYIPIRINREKRKLPVICPLEVSAIVVKAIKTNFCSDSPIRIETEINAQVYRANFSSGTSSDADLRRSRPSSTHYFVVSRRRIPFRDEHRLF